MRKVAVQNHLKKKKRNRKMFLAFLSNLPLRRSKKMTFHRIKNTEIKPSKGKDGCLSFSFLSHSVLLREIN